MAMIPQQVIDRILERLDIFDVVSDYIALKKAGRNFKANCPFHNEKTPSFIVSPDKQIFHCFGCGAGGNAIAFVMKYENLSFPEVVELLAAKTGVELIKEKAVPTREVPMLDGLYEVNKTAAAFYETMLLDKTGENALAYLEKRGVNAGTLKLFRLGYAPGDWEAFKKHCESKKIPLELARKAGLLIQNEKTGRDYDRFRDRIMFPVFNERGNIIAFGGRVMDDSSPKYINSPETTVYTKGNVLYGLNFSKRYIKEKGYGIIVEGYMDVIIPFQHGIMNVAAASGTALTSGQVSILKKYAQKAVMLFDADKAGEAASLRGLDIFIEHGMEVKVAALTEGDDPDSFVRKQGREIFEQRIAASKDLFSYKLDFLINKFGKNDVGAIVDEMLPTISKVGHAVVQSDNLRKLSEQLGIDEASLRYEMRKVRPDYSQRESLKSNNGIEKTKYVESEIYLLGLALADKSMCNTIMNKLGLDAFSNSGARAVLKLVNGIYSESGEKSFTPASLLARLESDEPARKVLLQALAKSEIMALDSNRVLSDCMSFVRKEKIKSGLKDLTVKLREAYESKNDSEVKNILGRINELHRKKVE